MRNITVCLLLALVCSAIAVLIVTTTVPVDREKLQGAVSEFEIFEQEEFDRYWLDIRKLGLTYELVDWPVLISSLLSVIAAIVFWFAFLHQGLDKLFFKKYYQQPDTITALRRGLWMGLLMGSTVMLQLLAVLTWLNLLIVAVILVMLELIFLNFHKLTNNHAH